MILLSLIRQVGVLFAVGFAGVVLLHAWQRRLRWITAIMMALIVTLPASAAVVGLVRYDRQMAQRSESPARTYLDFVRDPAFSITDQITEGVRLRVSEVGRLVVPGMFKAHGKHGKWLDPNPLVYVPLFVIVVIGWLKIVRGQPDVFTLTLPLYVGLYMAWPFDEATRFMLPTLPLLWVCVWRMIEPLEWRLSGLAVLLVVHLAVAIGFWVTEIPHFKECDEQWPIVERLAAPVRTDSGAVLAWNVPGCVHMMLALGLDRPVGEYVGQGPIGSDVRWLLMPSESLDPSGFVAHSRAGGYKLLVRAPGG